MLRLNLIRVYQIDICSLPRNEEYEFDRHCPLNTENRFSQSLKFIASSHKSNMILPKTERRKRSKELTQSKSNVQMTLQKKNIVTKYVFSSVCSKFIGRHLFMLIHKSDCLFSSIQHDFSFCILCASMHLHQPRCQSVICLFGE